MRTSLLILALLLADSALPFWWSPYSASAQLSLALEEGDTTLLARAVDLEHLQHIVAHQVHTNHSIQRNTMLDPKYQVALDDLIADLLRQKVARRTRHEEILKLIRQTL